MSFATKVADALTRVGQEIKDLREEGAGGGWILGPMATARPGYAAKAQASKASALRIAVLSDSTSDGFTNGLTGGSTNWRDIWPSRLAGLLREQYGLPAGGAGWIPPKPPTFVTGYNYNTAIQEPTAYTGYDDLNWSFGMPGGLWLQEGHATNKYRVRYPLTAGTTSVDVVTSRFGDGVVNITCANAASNKSISGEAERQFTRVNNPGAWVQIEGASGVGFAMLGIVEYVGDENNGVQVLNLSQAAIQASEVRGWLENPSFSTKPLISAFQPDVVLICLGNNDFGAGDNVDPNTVLGHLTAVAQACQSAVPGVEIVFVHRPDASAEWVNFGTLLEANATSMDATVLNLATDPRLTVDNTSLYLSDQIHFSAQGDEVMANVVADYMRVEKESTGGGLSEEEVETIVDAAIAANVPAVQTLIDTAMLLKPRRWSSEVIINSAALADGWNDNIGGVLVDSDIILTQASFRVANPAMLIGGTGNLQIQWYAGSPTALETELIATTQVAAGQHDVIVTFATPMPYTINTVLRAKITRGTTTVAGPCHIQWRGRYQ